VSRLHAQRPLTTNKISLTSVGII
jgi:hypothetical protein